MAKVKKEDAAVEVAAAAPVIDVKFKDLRMAVVAINESKLLASGIKLVGISKNEILTQFMAAVESIPDDPKTKKFPGPKIALDFYNQVLDLQEAAKKGILPPAPPAAAAKKKVDGKPVVGAAAKKAKEGEGKTKRSVIYDLVEGGKMDKATLIEAVQKEFPDSSKASTASYISHGMNEAYKKLFGKVIVANKDGLLSFKK